MGWHKKMSITMGVVFLALGLGLAACGSSGGGMASAGSGTSTISTQNVNGVMVLTGPDGKTVYFADQEANGQIKCTGSCNTFWKPVTVTAGSTPSGGSGVTGTLATVARPDGTTQVTYDGKPLYEFVKDSGSGQDSGNNFKDSFNGTNFTWHADTPAGTAAGSAPSTGGSGNNGGY